MSPETREKVEAALEWALYVADTQCWDDKREELRAALALLREDDGWCYDMEKAPRDECVPCAVEKAPCIFMLEWDEKAKAWIDGERRIWHPFAWLRIDLPTAKETSDD